MDSEKYNAFLADAEKRLETLGYKRDVAGSDFDTLCKAFATAYAKEPWCGILLTGGVGCGKTFGITSLLPTNRDAIVKLIQAGLGYTTPRTQLVRLTDPLELQWLEPQGDRDSGATMWRFTNDGVNVILDDLGNEPIKNDYGMKVDVAGNFIMRWYTDHFEKGNPGRLLVTTNLSGERLAERYGDRIADRLFSMVVVLPMKGESKRAKPIVIRE